MSPNFNLRVRPATISVMFALAITFLLSSTFVLAQTTVGNGSIQGVVTGSFRCCGKRSPGHHHRKV